MRDAGHAFAATARNPALRRAQLSFGASFAAEWAVTVAIAVVAYQNGGAPAVGLIGFLRTIPGALLGPVGGALADRFPRDRVLGAIGAVRFAALAAAAALLAGDAPVVTTYALVVLQTVAFWMVRPVHTALLPALCGTPRGLTEANVVRGMLDSLSLLIGPLLAALLIGVSSPAAVFAAAGLLSAASAWWVLRVSYEGLPAPSSRARLLAEAAAGPRALLGRSQTRVLTLLATAQTATRGALSVLVVVVSIELLDLGETGVGVLTAALGVGAVLGSLGVSLIASGRRLGALMGVGVALWGLPLVAAGALPFKGPTLVALAVIGAANAVMDVGYYTLLARLLPDHLLGRAMSVNEGLLGVGVALGAIVAPWAVAGLGIRGALVAIGLVAPAAVVLSWHVLRGIDAGIVVRDEEIAVLHRVDMLGPLPVPAVEHLAANLDRIEVAPATVVIREGEAGDRFYVIVDGEADVLRAGRPVRTMGPGECFGEIALLRDVPRTATVIARTPLRLYALDRRHFVSTVSGYRASVAEARELVGAHLARDTARRY